MLEPRLILIHLLIKLGVAATVSTVLGRSKEFRKLLFREHRLTKEKFYLALWMGLGFRPASGSVSMSPVSSWAIWRSIRRTSGCDWGRLSGDWEARWSRCRRRSITSGQLPLYVLAGIIAGQLRRFAPEQEDIWSFSPFVDLTIFRWIRRNLPRPRLFDWQVTFFVTIVGVRFLQTEIWHTFRPRFSAWRARTCG